MLLSVPDERCGTQGHRLLGNCYNFHIATRAVTWPQAEDICQANNGHLVSIMSQDEMTFVHFLLTTRWHTEETRTYIGTERTLSFLILYLVIILSL